MSGSVGSLHAAELKQSAERVPRISEKTAFRILVQSLKGGCGRTAKSAVPTVPAILRMPIG